MCNFDEDRTRRPVSGSRWRIWELANGCHCAVIGTCLTLADLRALARKLQVQTRPGYSADYQLHGFFVKAAALPEKPAKMLNKLLQKRHGSAIRRTKTMKTEVDLEAYWVETCESGDISGPYWAIVSHPAVTAKLYDRMFADVHMLSHLAGASVRTDIRRLQEMKERMAALDTKLAKQQHRHKLKLANKEQEIRNLRAMVRDAMAFATLPRKSDMPDSDACTCTSTPALQRDVSRLNTELNTTTKTIKTQAHRIEVLEGLAEQLHLENTSLEQTLLRGDETTDEQSLFDLGGRRVLYVGGRPRTVHRLRTLVEEWNGRFLHHDGGIERSIGELANAVSKADAVVFPTNCISHSAADNVKRLCHQTMKPFMPVRSSGVASFVVGLKRGLRDTVSKT